eukprot:7467706-Lingulodinium_polyedra.AAC.1
MLRLVLIDCARSEHGCNTVGARNMFATQFAHGRSLVARRLRWLQNTGRTWLTRRSCTVRA